MIYFYVVDESGNESEKTFITITVEPCMYCSLTQGGFGNGGGTYCEMSTSELLKALLMANNDLTVGSGNQTFAIPATGADSVIRILPGGETPAALPVGQWGCANPGNLLNHRTGRISNNLLSQTIVFQLNIYWSPGIIDLKFRNRTFYTSASSACPDKFNPQPVGTWKMYSFPASVWNKLSADDGKLGIADLLELANKPLGGGYLGLPISAFYEAVDMLNNAFHECAFLSYNPQVGVDTQTDEQNLVKVEPSISMNTAPNPFRNQTKISFSIEHDTEVIVEVLTLQGTKVAVLFNEPVKAHAIDSVDFSATITGSRQIYLVVVRTPYGWATMQMINVR